jgi:hypothetical protein
MHSVVLLHTGPDMYMHVASCFTTPQRDWELAMLIVEHCH